MTTIEMTCKRCKCKTSEYDFAQKRLDCPKGNCALKSDRTLAHMADLTNKMPDDFILPMEGECVVNTPTPTYMVIPSSANARPRMCDVDDTLPCTEPCCRNYMCGC